MDNMSITTAFTKGILAKILKKKIDKKLGNTGIELYIEDLNVSFDASNGGTFRVSIEGGFSQDDILKLVKELI